RHHAAGPDQRPGPDRDERQQRDSGPDLGAGPDGRAAHAVLGARAAGVRVVGDRNPGRQEAVVLQCRELVEADVAADLDAVAGAEAVVDDAVIPRLDVVAEAVVLADDDVVAGLQAGADVAAAVEDGAGPQPGPGTQDQARVRRGAPRGVADHHAGVGPERFG